MFSVKKLQLSIFFFKRACSGIHDDDEQRMMRRMKTGTGLVGYTKQESIARIVQKLIEAFIYFLFSNLKNKHVSIYTIRALFVIFFKSPLLMCNRAMMCNCLAFRFQILYVYFVFLEKIFYVYETSPETIAFQVFFMLSAAIN